jgi:transposase
MSAPNPECPGCQALQADVASLQAQLAQLQETVAELSARLKQHSGNSSRPPSADPPAAPKRAARSGASGKQRGGQPGHPGQTRALLPTEQADDVRPQLPEACAHCHADLGAVAPTAPARRHQVWELPPVKPQLTEYQLHARDCPHCGARTWATLPQGVPSRLAGPRLQAFCALLTGRFRLGRRAALELLEDAFGVTLSLGTLAALEADTAAALAGPYAAVAQAVAQAESLNADETGWKAAGKRPWLWLAATASHALFRIHDRRNRAAFEALLPLTATSIVTSDRYGVYTCLPLERRQLCWAHLARDFQALAERTGAVATIGRWAKDEIGKLFAHWQAFRRGALDRAGLQAQLAPIQRQFHTLLSWGSALTGQPGALCRDLQEKWEALWTFLWHPGVEPTNNHAERVLRPAVLWRKTSFGHQSERGKEYVERMLTVTATLRLQGQNVLAFLEAACQARLIGTPAPSLGPTAPASA